MRYICILFSCIFTMLLAACQNAPAPDYVEKPHIVEQRINLQQKLISMLPEEKQAAAREEAAWLADTAYKAAAAIGRYNDPIFVNWLNNRMVNTRKHVRHRGLCWHYQHDLYRELRRRPLKYYRLGCCVKDRGRSGEHHVVYIVDKNGPWPARSIALLDAWWYAGRLRVEDERDGKEWMDDPKTVENLNRIYPEGHNRPMEHWSMVRVSTRYMDYVYSDLPEARNTPQWNYMQEQMKKGLERRGGKAFDY